MSDANKVREGAAELFERLKTRHWSIFFREVFGPAGLIHSKYPMQEERSAFTQTSEYQDLLCMLSTLWEEPGRVSEHRAVITLRVPQSLHDLLKEEAHDLHTTINGLCIAKLILNVNPDLVPKTI